MAERPEIWVGIDVGKQTHHACAVDDTGKRLFSQKLANDQAAIEQLVGRVRGMSDRVGWAIDRPKRYNRRMRRVFYMAALSSLKHTQGPSRRFYDRKRGERLIHTQALLALARRLVDVLWALLRDGREFTYATPTPAGLAA